MHGLWNYASTRSTHKAVDAAEPLTHTLIGPGNTTQKGRHPQVNVRSGTHAFRFPTYIPEFLYLVGCLQDADAGIRVSAQPATLTAADPGVPQHKVLGRDAVVKGDKVAGVARVDLGELFAVAHHPRVRGRGRRGSEAEINMWSSQLVEEKDGGEAEDEGEQERRSR